MGQLSALGRAGRPRRVQDDCRVVITPVSEPGDGFGAGQRSLELAWLDEDAVGAGRLAALSRRVAHLVPADHRPGAGILHLEADLATLE